MSHRYLKFLPWYVNHTLEPAMARKVAVHLNGCPTCKREIDELSRLLSVQARTPPKRAIPEARLEAVLSRIDRYEQQQRRPMHRESMSQKEHSNRWFFGWLTVRPALAAAACAVLVLGILALPMLRSPADETAYRVLSTAPAVEHLRVRLRFGSAPTVDAVERLVDSGLSKHRLANAYRIEPRPNGEYIVIFAEKPAIAALSGLLADWRSAPEVADVAIDAE